MNPAECREILAACAAYWPHQPIPEVAERGWMDLLAGHDAAVVMEAVKNHAAAGEHFPPPPGVVLKTILDATNNLPDWDQVVDEIRLKLKELNRTRRFRSTPTFRFDTPEADEWSRPEIAELVHRSGGINVWRESLGSWGTGTDDTTFLAQQRNIWRGTQDRTSEHGRMNAIGATRLQELGEPQPIGELVAGLIGENE